MINNIRSSPMVRNLQRRARPVLKFLNKFGQDWSGELSALLAYHLLFSLIPTAVAFFGIFGLVLESYPDLREELKNKTINLFPTDNSTEAGIRKVVDIAFTKLANDAGIILIIGILFALLGASQLFMAIDKCLTIIYRLKERKFLQEQFLALGMIFVFILTIPLIIIVSSLPSALLSVIPGGFGRFATSLGGFFVSLTIAFVFFETIYLVVPNKKMTFKLTWCGALVAACALELYIILLPSLVRTLINTYKGQVGFAIILLVFFHYFATCLIVGAQINAVYFEHCKPLGESLGTFISNAYAQNHPDESHRPLLEDDTSLNEQLTTTTTNRSQQTNPWFNKILRPFKTNSPTQIEEEEQQQEIIS